MSRNFLLRTRVNKIEAMYKRSRVNINAEPRSTFTLFFSNFTAAVLVDKNKIFLRCELNSLSRKVCKKNCVGARLVT